MAHCLRRNVLSASESRRPRRNDLNVLRALGFAALLSTCALQGGCTETRGPSTPEERARFVALVRSLERDPLAENTNAIRQQLRDWAIEVPDIRVKVCSGLLGDAVGNYRYWREVTLSIGMFSAVVSMFADIGMPGLQQRAFLFLLLLWLCLVVDSLVRQNSGTVRQPSPPPSDPDEHSTRTEPR